MEHRHGKREPINVETLVYRQGLPVAWGRILNFGVGGAFVAFRNTTMSNGYYLEVEFTAALGGSDHKYRTQAIVVHRSQNGIGIMFDGPDHGVFDSLRTLVEVEKKRRISLAPLL